MIGSLYSGSEGLPNHASQRMAQTVAPPARRHKNSIHPIQRRIRMANQLFRPLQQLRQKLLYCFVEQPQEQLLLLVVALQ